MLRLHLALPLLIAIAAAPGSSAWADDKSEADQLSKEAIGFAQKGDFDNALQRYERALELDPGVKRQCNVGSAHFQLDQWAQAHLFLGLCLAHTDALEASFVEQLSKAYAFADRQLRQGDFALVDMKTTPGGGEILLQSLSKVARFTAPRRVWLPLGQHSFIATHPDYERQVGTFDLRTKGERDKEIEFRRPVQTETPVDSGDRPVDPATEGPIAAPVKPPPPPAEEPSRTSAWLAMGVGGLGLAAGIGFHVKAAGISSDLEGMPSSPERSALVDDLKRDRLIMAGFYGAGVVALGIGYYLWNAADAEERPMVAAGLTDGGASVQLGWQF